MTTVPAERSTRTNQELPQGLYPELNRSRLRELWPSWTLRETQGFRLRYGLRLALRRTHQLEGLCAGVLRASDVLMRTGLRLPWS